VVNEPPDSLLLPEDEEDELLDVRGRPDSVSGVRPAVKRIGTFSRAS
jgi:hypothetical protein